MLQFSSWRITLESQHTQKINIQIFEKLFRLWVKKKSPQKLDHGNTFLPSPILLQISSVLWTSLLWPNPQSPGVKLGRREHGLGSQYLVRQDSL